MASQAKLGEILLQFKADITEMVTALNMLQTELRDTAIAAAGSMQPALKAQIKAFDDSARYMNLFGNDLKKMGSSMGKVFDPLAKSLVTVGALATVASAAFIKATVDIGGEFERNMLLVKGVTQATKKDFEELVEIARELSKELPVSAADASRAMYELASAGLSTKEIMESIKPITQMAVSQASDVAQISTMVVGLMKSFDLPFTQTAKVINVLNNAVVTSMFNVDKLQYALRYVAPVARQVGLSLEETTAAISALADAGLTGEQIGTGFRTVLAELIQPGRNAAKTIEDLGIKVWDASGKFRRLPELFQQFKSGGVSPEDIFRIWGREGATAASRLIHIGAALEEYEHKMVRAGTTTKLLNDMITGILPQLQLLSNAFKDVLVESLWQSKGSMGGLITGIREVILEFDNWAQETKFFEQVFTSFLNGIGIHANTFDDLKKAIHNINLREVNVMFKSFGTTVREVFMALKNLVDMVPWEALLTNIDQIGKLVFWGWIISHGLQWAGNILQMVASLRILSEAFGHATLAATAFSMVTKASVWLVGIEVGIKLIQSWKREAQEMKDLVGETEEEINNMNVEELEAKLKAINAAIKEREDMASSYLGTSPEALLLEVQKKRYADLLEKLLAVKDAAKKAGAATQEMGELTEAAAARLGGEKFDKAASQMSEIEANIVRATQNIVSQLSEFRVQAEYAMKSGATSTEQMAKVLKDRLTGSIKLARKTMDDAFGADVAEVFVKRLSEIGSKSGDALLSSVAESFRRAPVSLSGFSDAIIHMFEDTKLAAKKFFGEEGLDLSQAFSAATELAMYNLTQLAQQADDSMRSIGVDSTAAAKTLRDRFVASVEDIRKELENMYGKAVADKFISRVGEMATALEKANKEVLGGLSKSIAELGNPDQLFSTDNIRSSLTTSLGTFIEQSRKLFDQGRLMMRDFGTSSKDAFTVIKEEVTKKAQEAAEALVTKFNNPLLKKTFAEALRALGKASGQALYTELADAVEKGGQKLEDLQKKIDEYNKQQAAMKEKQATGDAYLAGVWGDKETWGVKKGMKYENAEKGSYEDYFNEPVYEMVDLQKPTAEINAVNESIMGSVQAIKSAGDSLQPVIASLLRDLKGADLATTLVAPVKTALDDIQAAGGSVGAASGKSWGEAFYNGVKEAIDKVQSYVNNLPTAYTFTVRVTGGTGSADLAREIAAAGRSR